MGISTVVAIIIGILAVIGIVLFGVLFGYLYWWRIARAQPRLSGVLAMTGLDAPVDVLRDKHGVPHIYAITRADLFRTQGFVHAQDRMWQMEQNRRIAAGTLAELFGEAALDADRFSRTVGFLRAAQREYDALDDETRAVLSWYAEGVNAYITSRLGRLAPELNLLGARPAPWTPLDSLAYLKLVAWGQSANWESELVRLLLLAESDPYRASELEPSASPRTPAILEADGVPHARLVYAAGLLLNFMEPLKQWVGGLHGGQGSNAWVVAPKRSLTRKAVLANDTHLPAQIPVVWYEVHLACPDFEAAGASFAGAPGVIIGHNEFLAWGLANGQADQQDLYLERENPQEPGAYGWRGGWEAAQVFEEHIRVRGRQQPHVERVIVTRHGPLLTGLLGDAKLPPLAVRWVGSEGGGFLRSALQLNRAATMEEAVDALRAWSAPSQSVVLADVRGALAYRFAGQIPGRAQNPGIVPAPGWTGEHEWQGFVPFDELPHLDDPESGRIVAANNRPAGDDYPHFLGLEFDPGYRAQRIDEMLAERERYSVRDMEEIQLDVTSRFAGELVRWLTLLNSENPWEKISIQALRKWNLRMDTDSTAALVFHYVLIDLLWMVYGDKLGAARSGYLGTSATPIFPFSSHVDKAQEHLLALLGSEEQSVWYTEAATGRRRTRDELLQEALTHAVHQIRELLGDSALKWQWGRSHQVMYAHPMGSARLLRSIFNRGPFPVGGDNSTPLQTRYTPQIPLGMVQVIPTYRQIIEVGAWDRMTTIIATGQSGHPISSNYDDQMMMWREGVYHVMPWQRAAVEKIAAHTLRIEPAHRG